MEFDASFLDSGEANEDYFLPTMQDSVRDIDKKDTMKGNPLTYGEMVCYCVSTFSPFPSMRAVCLSINALKKSNGRNTSRK